ncbi:SRPBCC family protein [Thermoleptolyngbya sichuanensis XZ-Cy5]|uniref:SRPBCC family protein n=1 Tax=Thermoleptolyngbya sichuanensis TaxID=2885951 RepID=UPI00240CED29|nr:SRPBCC family protein [Thermoleptolyngbya sichuanensis]MDG2615612.1 SRPBCC family protein [Thermoleptolyngbya sichuanensis XZ-Cy5]
MNTLPFSDSMAKLAATNFRHLPKTERDRLLRGEILITPHPIDLWGTGVTAQMHLPLSPDCAWSQLTQYPRWVEYFPDISQSQVLHECAESPMKTLFQAASKTFLMLSVQVEVYLNVIERMQGDRRQIRFQQERGSFKRFVAELVIEPLGFGALLSYSVEAAPSLPIPAPLIQEAVRLDLPRNMQQMRRVLCGDVRSGALGDRPAA